MSDKENTQIEETEEITEETNYKDVRKKGFIKLDKNLIRVLRA